MSPLSATAYYRKFAYQNFVRKGILYLQNFSRANKKYFANLSIFMLQVFIDFWIDLLSSPPTQLASGTTKMTCILLVAYQNQ